MPYKEKPIEKLYYSIGEVAQSLDVNVSLIRFWEKQFDILQILKLIYHLVKERGFTLEGAKNKLIENREDTINNFEIVSRLKEIRNFLVELKEGL